LITNIKSIYKSTGVESEIIIETEILDDNGNGFFWHFDSRLVTEILKKMEGKLPDMAVNHIMARALQASYLMC
jgi:hypothetical protein